MVIDARTPVLFAALAAVLFATAAALVLMPADPWDRLRRFTRWSPRVLGALCGALAATLCGVLLVAALGSDGFTPYLIAAITLLVGLLLGVYLPGSEARRHARRRTRLDLQAIDFASYLVRALAGSAGEVALLREYTRRDRPRVREMQQVVRAVVAEHQRSAHGTIWELLHQAMRATGSQPCIDLSGTMVEVARQDRRQLVSALDAQRQQLLRQVVAAHEARAQRSELIILVVSGCSLFLGVMVGMLYVMTGGLTVFSSLGY